MATYTPVRPVFATLPEFPSLGESLEFQLTGLAVVFIALSSIWGLLELMGWIFRAIAKRADRRVPPPAPSPLVTLSPGFASRNGALPTEVAAAITAAVFVVCDGQHCRIASITPADAGFDWAREGRREIFASHRMH